MHKFGFLPDMSLIFRIHRRANVCFERICIHWTVALLISFQVEDSSQVVKHSPYEKVTKSFVRFRVFGIIIFYPLNHDSNKLLKIYFSS